MGDEIEIRPGIIKGNKVEPLYTRVIGLQKAGYNLEEVGPGGLVGLMTNLDPFLTKDDRLSGTIVGLANELPENRSEIEAEVSLLERVVGEKKERKAEPLRKGEKVLINVATQRTIGLIKEIKGSRVVFRLALPVVAEQKQRIVISRQIDGRWRLIGYGILTS